MPDKLLFIINGGLGDLLSEYFNTREWRILKELKTRSPSIRTKLILCNHNSSSIDFLKYYPYFDEIEPRHGTHLHLVKENNVGHYIAAQCPDWTFIGEAYYMWKDIEPKQPEVYLGEEDTALIDEVKAAGKYIVLHPFAGTPGRICLTTEEYKLLADKIVDELKCNVVVMGATHSRIIEEATVGITENLIFKEHFDSHRPEIISLVNKASCRAAVKLSMDASGYIGNYTGLIIAPWVAEIRTVAYIAETHRTMSEISYSLSWPTSRKWAYNKSFFPEVQDHTEVIDQTIKFLSEEV